MGCAKLVVSDFLNLSKRKQNLEGWKRALPPSSGCGSAPEGWQKLLDYLDYVLR